MNNTPKPRIPKFTPFNLSERWTISRGRDTCGYNVCTITDGRSLKTRAHGGGYDMAGTALAEMLCEHPVTAPIILAMLRRKVKANAIRRSGGVGEGRFYGGQEDGLYGCWYISKGRGRDEKFGFDDGVGSDTVIRLLLKHCGIKIEPQYDLARKRRARNGWLIRPATKDEVESALRY